MVDILILLILGLIVYELGKYVHRNHIKHSNHHSNVYTCNGNVYTLPELKFDNKIIGDQVENVEKKLIDIGYKVDITTDLTKIGQPSTTNDTIILITNKSNLVQTWRFK